MTFKRRSRHAISEERLTVDLAGRPIALLVRRHPRARRLIVSVDAANDHVVLTLPRGVALAEGLAMARARASWIAARLDSLPPRIPFAAGARVPYLGVDHVIRHRADAPRPVLRGAGEIVIGGRPEHLARRLKDWFKAEARREIAPRVAGKADLLGRRPGRITLRDTRSRWGSCAANGNLSFNWRLVMTPAHVLDYVVAHEVAHLEVMDHGPAFWRTVAALTADVEGPRTWLSRHGEALHRYG